MIQELKTIVIVVSATLAALFVHHALEQAQASAGEIVSPKAIAVPVVEDAIPIFE